MTTTATFQGMDEGKKPSSRVLAPPGGGSSNIFGGYEDDSEKKNARSSAKNVNKANNDIFGTGEQIATGTSPGKKHNPSNVNCGNNDIFNRETHAAPSQPKSRAPRSGDDSFNNLFGDSSCGYYAVGQESAGGFTSHTCTKNQDQSCESRSRVDISQSKGISQSRHSNSFANVFGDGEKKSNATPESKFRRHNNRDDSFSNVFNHLKSPNLSSPSAPVNKSSPSTSCLEGTSPKLQSFCDNGNDTLPTSLNDLSLGGGDTFVEDDHDINSSFSRVLGQYQSNVTPRANRFSDRGEFNPITGMAYEKPAQKEPQAESAQEVKEEGTNQEGAVQQEQKGQAGASSGVFGGPEPTPKPHASTRVSQPPGGRSTKLW
ncbi:hematological and neurological expressed 1-like protein [Elysia marginata]|uniref:Microtubule-associated protein Jupiter n=1 Tax=Elysia marginata TaxID=1093978 RepID=A0AAV4GLF4_9GAST|nr:hematological and neurological expressed 1-like protein [Elysia marginata]